MIAAMLLALCMFCGNVGAPAVAAQGLDVQEAHDGDEDIGKVYKIYTATCTMGEIRAAETAKAGEQVKVEGLPKAGYSMKTLRVYLWDENENQEYVGTPYNWGYSCAPGVGIDCSGLVMQALYATGMNTAFNPYIHPDQEDTTGKMYSDSRFMHVSLDNRQRGDLIFYPGHVAIYPGNNQVINARGGG